MNEIELYRSFSAVDDDILLRSESAGKKRFVTRRAALAACLCILALAAALLPGALHEPEGEEGGKADVDDPETVFTPTYNAISAPEVSGDGAMSWLCIPAVFTRALTEEELDALTPGKPVGYMQLSGTACFNGEGTLQGVTLTVTTTAPEAPVTLVITPAGGMPRDFVLPEEGELSPCNGVDYRVYEYGGAAGVTLAAEAELGGSDFFFTLATAQDELTQAKQDFAEILECFTYYDEGQPDLSAITAGELPWWTERALTLTEARQDERFGAYLPAAVPRGFAEESVRRWRDQWSQGLSALWTRGYDELSWQIRDFTEADEQRLTTVEETENYDLSLYPILRAESVPEALREIVDDPVFEAAELTEEAVRVRVYRVEDSGDSDGWRMAFSVRYGDTLITVRARGVAPDWVWQQLTALRAQ